MNAKKSKHKGKKPCPQQVEQLKTPTSAEVRRRTLARMEAALQKDPQAALREAQKALDYGAELLLKLVRSKVLFRKMVFGDGEEYAEDAAELCLCGRISWLVDELRALVKRGHDRPLFTAWHASKQLADALHEVALRQPEKLRPLARHSLFMPSLRAKSKTFKHDFDKAAEAIQLSHDCVVDMNAKALHQLDRPATRFVAEVLERIADLQHDVEREAETLARFQALAERKPKSDFAKYRGVSLEEFWSTQRPRHPEALSYQGLPPLTKSTAPVWWEKAVKPYLERPETLERLKDTAFYEELRQATATGKDYEMRDELKRRCKPKLTTLARPA